MNQSRSSSQAISQKQTRQSRSREEKKEEEEGGATDKNIRVNIKWGKKPDKKETLAQHLKNKEKAQKQEAKGYYKPMFKTEEDEKEQLDMWMDLINENEENYEPKAPHSFLKRGQG